MVYRPLRLHHVLLTYVIDDALLAASSKGHCTFVVKTLVLLLTAQGFYLSWDKCQFVPVQHGKFLGLIVDSRACKMFVPADKKLYIHETVDGMLSARHYTNRQLASVAGMLMSIAPAVSMAPLYLRKLYQSMGGNMDEETGNAALAREDLQYWHDNLDLADGKSWLKHTSLIHVCGDASKVGYGAFTPNGELYPAVCFNPEEIRLMSVNKLSSVFCEVKIVRLAVEAVVRKLGSDIVGGKVIVYTGDCLPAIQSLPKMKGTVDVFPEVRQLYRFVAAYDVHLDYIWESRESDLMLHADMLSRLEDSSEIFLLRVVFKRVCLREINGVIWGWPTLDVFAGDAKNQHVMSRYYILFHSPRALGANAMYQNWQHDACRHGLPGMLWVFPPFPLVGAVVNKLLFEQVDTILILPKLCGTGCQCCSNCLLWMNMSCLGLMACTVLVQGRLIT